MSVTLFLTGAKLASDVLQGTSKVRGAKQLGNLKKETSEMLYQYNKKQLEKSYISAFQNTMSSYIDNRLKIAEEYQDVNTKLNIQASQDNINLADSSFTNDAQNNLDMEFNKNLQNAYSNLMNQASSLIVNKTTQDVQLDQQRFEQFNNINNAVAQVEQESWDKIASSAMEFGTQAFDEYRANKAKKGLDNGLDMFTPKDSYLHTDIVDTYKKSKGYSLNDFDFNTFKL